MTIIDFSGVLVDDSLDLLGKLVILDHGRLKVLASRAVDQDAIKAECAVISRVWDLPVKKKIMWKKNK